MTTSIFLLKLKGFFQVAWAWLKSYWVYIALAIGIVLAILFAKKKQDALNAVLAEYKSQTERNRQDMEQLRRIHQESVDRQLEINRRYQETIDRIEKNYRDALTTLDANRRKEIQTIITETHDNPEVMAQRINTLFNLPIYP